jgi:hypothetical protein
MSADNNEFIKLQKQVDSLKMIAGVLSAVLAVGFTAGIVWTQLVAYEERVNTQGQQITAIEKQMSDFKHNLGELSEPSYQIEVTTENGPEGSRCEKGNVITGLRHEGQRIWITCVSLGRAVYNPGDERPREPSPERP